MSIKSFKFVSPGIFINEVDNSQLPRLPEELGPVIIGRAERGPGMVPVKIDSFSDFVETFGSPIAGGEGDDVWRQGNRLGPTYAAFAAQAYLKSASPITFVRLLGEANANATDEGKAGWKVNHAYGLFVGDSSESADDRHLAAVIYSDNADLGLLNGAAVTNDDFTLADSGKIIFADSTGTSATSAKVDLTIDTAIAGTGATMDLEIESVPSDIDNLSIKNANVTVGGGASELAFTFNSGAAVGVNTPTSGGTGSPSIEIGTSGATADDVATQIATEITSYNATYAGEFPVTASANTDGDQPTINMAQKSTTGSLSDVGGIDGFINTFPSGTERINFVDGTSGVVTFLLRDTVPSSFTISLDPTTPTSAYVATTLTVGLQGHSSTSAQATALAAAINLPAFVATVTASPSGSVVSLVQDDTGSVSNILGFLPTSPMPSQITSSGFVNGAAAVLNYSKTVFNFDENSKLYIRNVLNTNPVLTNDDVTNTEAPTAKQNYWLGATFDSSLSDPTKIEEGKVSNIDKARLVKLGAVLGTSDGKFNDMNLSAQAPSTPMVVSQYTGLPAEFTPQTPQVQSLFKVHALYAGEWEQKNFKISISDVAGPKNSFTKYGTFSVIVRDAKDTDAAPVVYERFSNCDLDPNSSNYIGVKIGDMKQVWSPTELRYIEEGQYLNQSRFIRVEVVDAVESGTINAELLPFGFMAPKTFADIIDTQTYKFPQLSLRGDSRGTKISSPSQAFFGITTEDSSERFDPSYADATRRLVNADADLTEHTKFFSLDLLKTLGNVDAEYDETSMSGATSFNGASGDYSTVLDKGFNKFTMPLTGGIDGLNITEIEPFCDTHSGSSAVDNYAFNSMKKAIDMVSDPEVVECNLMAIPGVANPGITSHLISTCENRADALAVIDIEHDYTPRGWDLRTESLRLPDVSLAVNKLRDRRINSSYGCAYFPWVQVRDAMSDKLVWMPPSVAALGTMASSAAKSELWFAPAGFTRGGLSNGAAGLPVIQTRYRLTSKHRDSLYEANINPIAQFPAEGIVIFGQKTLQVTPSALDRINVRRLMVYVKKEISRMAATLLFDQNVDSTWNRFLSKAEPFLASVKSRFGLTEYRVVLDETTTTPELVDRNIMYAKVFLKPARAIEFIAIDFVITNTGASFDD